MNVSSAVSGVLFIVVGAMFLLDRLDVIDLRPSLVWPLLLIGLGVAVLLGGRRHRPHAPPPAEHEAPEAPPTTSERDDEAPRD